MPSTPRCQEMPRSAIHVCVRPRTGSRRRGGRTRRARQMVSAPVPAANSSGHQAVQLGPAPSGSSADHERADDRQHDGDRERRAGDRRGGLGGERGREHQRPPGVEEVGERGRRRRRRRRGRSCGRSRSGRRAGPCRPPRTSVADAVDGAVDDRACRTRPTPSKASRPGPPMKAAIDAVVVPAVGAGSSGSTGARSRLLQVDARRRRRCRRSAGDDGDDGQRRPWCRCRRSMCALAALDAPARASCSRNFRSCGERQVEPAADDGQAGQHHERQRSSSTATRAGRRRGWSWPAPWRRRASARTSSSDSVGGSSTASVSASASASQRSLAEEDHEDLAAHVEGGEQRGDQADGPQRPGSCRRRTAGSRPSTRSRRTAARRRWPASRR